MEKIFVNKIINYAKKMPCINNGYNDCGKRNRCLLYSIPYSFGEAGKSIRKRKFGEFEDEEDYHHTEDLCFLLIHHQDIHKFKKHLEEATLSIKGCMK